MGIGPVVRYWKWNRHRRPAAFVMAIGSTITWTLFGTALRPLLSSERAVRGFNILMALLLLASLYPVFMDA